MQAATITIYGAKKKISHSFLRVRPILTSLLSLDLIKQKTPFNRFNLSLGPLSHQLSKLIAIKQPRIAMILFRRRNVQ